MLDDRIAGTSREIAERSGPRRWPGECVTGVAALSTGRRRPLPNGKNREVIFHAGWTQAAVRRA
jgi:hypothetical protein